MNYSNSQRAGVILYLTALLFGAYTIFIKDGAVLDKAPEKEVREKGFDGNLLDGISYDNSPPVDEDGAEIEFKSKKRNLNSKQYKKNACNREKNSN